MIGGAVAGQRINGFLWENLGTGLVVALGVGLLAFVAFSLLRRPRTRIVATLTVAASLGLFLVVGYRRPFFGMQFLWPHGTYNTLQAHYMVAPTLLLLSALFVQLDGHPRGSSPTPWNRLRVAVVAVVFVVALFSFEVGESKVRGSPRWTQAVDEGRSRCTATGAGEVKVPIAPQPFWYARLPCSKLR